MTNESTPWNQMPKAPLFRSTAADETDWMGDAETPKQKFSEIRRAARQEADAWVSTKTASTLPSPSELKVQALGFAEMWAGQFGDRSGIGVEAFMDRVAATTTAPDGAVIDWGGNRSWDVPEDGDISEGFDLIEDDRPDPGIYTGPPYAGNAADRKLAADYEDYFEEDRSARIRYEHVSDDEDVDTTTVATRKTASANYQMRLARDWDGEWVDAGESLAEAHAALMNFYKDGQTTLAFLKNNYNNTVWVYEIHPPAFNLVPTNKGSYDTFYGGGMSKFFSSKHAMGNPNDARALDDDDGVNPEFMPAQVEDMVPTTKPFNAGEWTVEGVRRSREAAYQFEIGDYLDPEYPVIIFDKNGDVIDRAGNLATAETIVAAEWDNVGGFSIPDGGVGFVKSEPGASGYTKDEAKAYLQWVLDTNTDLWSNPVAASKTAASPGWLRERVNDPYGTPNKVMGEDGEYVDNPFWVENPYEDINDFRVIERDGKGYVMHRRQNYWMNFNSRDEAVEHARGADGSLDMWASKTASQNIGWGHSNGGVNGRSKDGRFGFNVQPSGGRYTVDVYDDAVDNSDSAWPTKTLTFDSEEEAMRAAEQIARKYDGSSARYATQGKYRVFRVLDARKQETLEGIQAYMPRNFTASQDADGTIWISGHDQSGWNGQYIVERLASGLHFVEEVTDDIAANANTPAEQRTWASKKTAYKIIEEPDAHLYEPYLPFSVVDDAGLTMSRRPNLQAAQEDLAHFENLDQFRSDRPDITGHGPIFSLKTAGRYLLVSDDVVVAEGDNIEDLVLEAYGLGYEEGYVTNQDGGKADLADLLARYASRKTAEKYRVEQRGTGTSAEGNTFDSKEEADAKAAELNEKYGDQYVVTKDYSASRKTARKNVTEADAKAILKKLRENKGYDEDEPYGPKIVKDWDFMGYGNPAPWSIVWEEGPYEWAYTFPHGGIDAEFGVKVKPIDIPSHIYAEPITSWSIGLYPSGNTTGRRNKRWQKRADQGSGPSEDHQSGDGESGLADVEVSGAPENFDQMWLDGNPAGRKVEQDNPEDTKATGPAAPSGEGKKPAGAAPQVDVAGHDDTAMFESGEIEGDWDEENKGTNPNTTKAASLESGPEYDLFES